MGKLLCCGEKNSDLCDYFFFFNNNKKSFLLRKKEIGMLRSKIFFFPHSCNSKCALKNQHSVTKCVKHLNKMLLAFHNAAITSRGKAEKMRTRNLKQDGMVLKASEYPCLLVKAGV